MGRKKRWIESEIVDGVATVDISTWKYFNDYICDEMLDYTTYIWRGQMREEWKLEPTIDRILKQKNIVGNGHIRTQHLESFKYATRGRRGTNPAILESDNDWWALGQHHGLATPLLDWSSSPYVAAFFAFAEINTKPLKKRTIYAVSRDSISNASDKIINGFKGTGRAPIVEFFKPLSDENARLVNQGGLFTRSPDGVDLETWIRENFIGESSTFILIKFLIPNSNRNICLRTLNRMNINHLTLFPDLYGASNFCNIDLIIDSY